MKATRVDGKAWRPPAAIGALVAAVAAAFFTASADLQEPPRFDGAGYAVLAESLADGRGYREIDHPDAPRHAHFPPGYPAALALIRTAAGPQFFVPAAHLASLAFSLAATLAAWRWFLRAYRPTTALLMALALAVNWAWDRTAGAIQSEPLFNLLALLALLATPRVAARGDTLSGVLLGLGLAACTLTRHVGAPLALAVVVELALRQRKALALVVALACAAGLVPWALWLLDVRANTQAALLDGGSLASQALFYAQRLPDLLTGPFVEVATVFRSRPALAAALNLWALLATALLALGLARALRNPRRRLAALYALATLALLLAWPFTEAGRFLIPLLPALLVAAVEGLAAPLALAFGKRSRPRRTAALLVLAAALPYSVYAATTQRAAAGRRTHRDVDAALAWLAREADQPGPVFTTHPGEVYLRTGRHALAPTARDPDALADEIARRRAAYLLVDVDRYANAPANPLARLVREHPDLVRPVGPESPSVRLYRVVRPVGNQRGLPSNRSVP